MCHTTRDDDDDDDAFLQNAETHTRRNANALCWVREREKELYNIIFFYDVFFARLIENRAFLSSHPFFSREEGFFSPSFALLKRRGRQETAKGTLVSPATTTTTTTKGGIINEREPSFFRLFRGEFRRRRRTRNAPMWFLH